MPPNQTSYGTPPNIGHHQKHGRSLATILIILLLVIALIASITFAVWAFGGRQDYKNNSDQKAATAVAQAVKQEDDKQVKIFAEQEKSPYKTYKGPDTYGGVTVTYPKTWDAYIVNKDTASSPVDGYFYPGFVPDIAGTTAFALRLEVLNQSYSQALETYKSQAKAGKVRITAYSAPMVKGVVGSRIDGEITTGQKDSMILLPLRDKTLRLSTESSEFLNDFNKIILPKLKFVP